MQEMLRWLGPKAPGQADPIPSVLQDDGDVTDDPLAILQETKKGQRQIYSVSRSVFLPRVCLKSTGVNPLFRDPHTTPISSSGYGSTLDDPQKLREDVVHVLEQNPHFVRSIKMPPARSSSSSGGGTLTAIPEGAPVPQPVWPQDSLVDDALLLYTSLTNHGSDGKEELRMEINVREVLVELLNGINGTMEMGLAPEEVLKRVNDKIAASIEALRLCTEEEMRRLCINLSNCKKMNSVLKAFGKDDDLYQSGSSSSGFSDLNPLPVFIHDDLGSVPNGLRNAMIYGTLYRGKKEAKKEGAKKSSLRDVNDNKPSVWEQYYGVRAVQEGRGGARSDVKPSDVPLFPGGRPEADFTLDVPRSELLSKRMKEDKKWRCRCRLLTSFLGLVFFLLSVMAVSLMLTRGKRMFGSMM